MDVLIKNNQYINASIYGDKMKNCTHKYKAMPDVMCMPLVFQHIENNTRCIRHTTGNNPVKYHGWHRGT